MSFVRFPIAMIPLASTVIGDFDRVITEQDLLDLAWVDASGSGGDVCW
jgi:hypothetical protein